MSPDTRLLLLLAAATGIAPFMLHAIAPGLPEVAESFGVSSAVAQLLLSLGLAAMAVATVFLGTLSDAVGRRPVLLVSMGVAAIGSAVVAVAPTIEVAIAGRVAQAAAAAGGITIARAVAADLYDRDRATAFIAKLTAVMVLMPMIAPAAGGELVVAFGWRSVFIVGTLLTIATWLGLWLGVRETLEVPSGRVDLAHLFSGLAYAAESRIFWGCTLFSALQMAAFFSFVGAAPFVMREAYGFGPEIYGRYFVFISAIFMASNYAASLLSAQLGTAAILRLGAFIAVVGVGAMLFALASGMEGPVWLFIPAGVNAVAAGLSLPSAVSLAVLDRAKRAGAASSFVGFAQFLLAGIATQVGGALPHTSPLPVIALLWALSTLGVLICGVLAPGVFRRNRALSEP
ncbi:MAG: MFS transporter [Pseudomonadota bacterium]